MKSRAWREKEQAESKQPVLFGIPIYLTVLD